MRTLAFFACITLILASCKSSIDTETGKKELKALLLDYYTALVNKDLKKMNELTTANFVFFNEGTVYNNESAAQSIDLSGKFSVAFRFDSFNVYINKANTSAYYFRETDFTFGDSTYPAGKSLESATFRMEGRKWKIRFLHSSSNEKKPLLQFNQSF